MILFVGDKPSKDSDPNHAFKGAKCRARLEEWIYSIIPQSEEPEDYMIINRVDEYFLECVESHFKQGNPIVALGNNAAKALRNFPHFKLPHPSGLNRKLNNKKFVKRQLCRASTFIILALKWQSTAVQQYATNPVRF